MVKTKKRSTKLRAWAVTSKDARVGICWRPSPLWNPTPFAIFERKIEAESTAEKYNKDAIVPNYKVIPVLLTFTKIK